MFVKRFKIIFYNRVALLYNTEGFLIVFYRKLIDLFYKGFDDLIWGIEQIGLIDDISKRIGSLKQVDSCSQFF